LTVCSTVRSSSFAQHTFKQATMPSSSQNTSKLPSLQKR
jgi:hypothetical protein